MKSNFIKFQQNGESVFINKNMIVAVYANELLCSTTIKCLGDYAYCVDENINEVIKCLE